MQFERMNKSDYIQNPRLLHIKKEITQMLSKPNPNRVFNPHFKDNIQRQSCIKNVLHSSSKILSFKENTFHLALNLFDCMLSKYKINSECYTEIALVCLSLSSKINECQGSALNLNHLESIFEPQNCTYPSLEHKILISLDFKLRIVGPFDFILLFANNLDITFFGKFEQMISKGTLFKKRQLFLELANELLLVYSEKEFNPLIVALSVIMVFRQINHFARAFPFILEFVSGYNKETVDSCYFHFLYCYFNKGNRESVHGFEKNNLCSMKEFSVQSTQDISDLQTR